MKSLTLSTLLLLATFPAAGQTVNRNSDDGVSEARRFALVGELQSLAAECGRLREPLAEAAAKAEVADAAWTLDRELADRLLREAYRLTLPKERQESKAARPANAQSLWASAEGRARLDIRVRVMSIASRDKKLAGELVRLSEEQGVASEGRDLYGQLARAALDTGDVESASRFVEKSFEFDPNRGAAARVINELARRDRAAADQLILKYIESLRRFPLSNRDGSAAGMQLTFIELLEPNSFFGDPNGQVPPPGAEVMRAYVGYVIESLGAVERNEPGSIKFMRGLLMSAWLPLRQYAPEMAGAFMELEVLSRTPGRDAPLPTPADEKAWRERAERLRRAAAESDSPDDRTINSLIGHGDYDRARKAIDKLPDGPRKRQHAEKANLSEALGLAAKGDIATASVLAERLNKAASVVQVYTALIKTCAGRKDAPCVSSLGLRAMKQLEKADAAPFAPPAGTPSNFFATGRETDAALDGLSKLAAAVAPFDRTLGFEIFDRMVQAAGRSSVDTGLGRAGYDVSVFARMAALDETRARQAAGTLEDPLRRITALAAIYRRQAEALNKSAARRPPDAAQQ